MKQTILIIEDDRNLNDGIKFALRSEYYCLQADTIETARKYCTEDAVNLVLLDVNLPDGSGFDFYKNYVNRHRCLLLFLPPIRWRWM